jgi:hypothetical protein
VIKKNSRTLACGTGSLLAGLLIPAAVYGFAGNLTVIGEWARTLSASTPGLLRVGDNASMFAFLAKVFHLSEKSAMIAGGIAAIVLGFLLLLMILRGTGEKMAGAWFAETACLLMFIPMFSPLGWNYNYLYGLPAVFALLVAWPGFKAGEKAALAADFVFIGGTLRETLGKTAFRFYTRQALVVPGFLFAFVLLFIGRRRRIL